MRTSLVRARRSFLFALAFESTGGSLSAMGPSRDEPPGNPNSNAVTQGPTPDTMPSAAAPAPAGSAATPTSTGPRRVPAASPTAAVESVSPGAATTAGGEEPYSGPPTLLQKSLKVGGYAG